MYSTYLVFLVVTAAIVVAVLVAVIALGVILLRRRREPRDTGYTHEPWRGPDDQA